jgi:hypothetical protein
MLEHGRKGGVAERAVHAHARVEPGDVGGAQEERAVGGERRQHDRRGGADDLEHGRHAQQRVLAVRRAHNETARPRHKVERARLAGRQCERVAGRVLVDLETKYAQMAAQGGDVQADARIRRGDEARQRAEAAPVDGELAVLPHDGRAGRRQHGGVLGVVALRERRQVLVDLLQQQDELGVDAARRQLKGGDVACAGELQVLLLHHEQRADQASVGTERRDVGSI